MAAVTSDVAMQPLWPGLLNADEGGAYLVGARCERCGGLALGLREFCPHCHASGTLREVRIGRRGRLYTATVIHQGPSRFASPYRVGYVDIEDGVRVFAHLQQGEGAPRIGDDVVLEIRAVVTDKDGTPLAAPFYLASSGDGR
jgi:uncharacterized OB-fold protein